MNLAIYFGTVPPYLFGAAQQYIDGKPCAPTEPPKGKNNAARRKGEETRARIMELIDEWDEVDMNFLVAEETIGLTRRAIQAHLNTLIDAGQLIRIDPDKPRPGASSVWKRPLVAR